MKMKLIVLAALTVSFIAFAQDAGTDAGTDGGTRLSDTRLSDIYAVCPEAPPMTKLDGGWFLPDAREKRIVCMKAGCEAYAKRLEANAREEKKSESGAGYTALGVLLVLGIGIGIGYAVREHLAP